MKRISPVTTFFVMFLFLTSFICAQSVITPESHFGFKLGTDGKLASWEQIVSYFEKLDRESDRVISRNLGETTLGNPFLLVTISSAENLRNLDRLSEISRRLASGRASTEELDRLTTQGKAIVAVTNGLHSTEVAATQMAPGLAYSLASGDDKETREILENTIFLLFPCFNPDGTKMVVEWAEKTRGTNYQGSSPPDLYHHYAGHDNNRDAYMLNLNESRLFAQVIYHEWIPQLYLDNHQMGSYGARLYVPPYDDPINPNVDPLVWLEHELIGANMQIALERSGIQGVVAGAPYTGWWFPSFHMVTNHHNIAGMLTETASCRLAWPIFIHPHQLRPHGRSHAVYDRMQIFPNPWPGGWWTLAQMIHQQEVSTKAMLTAAARNRETLLRNMHFKARRTVERGKTDLPSGFIIPGDQNDRLTVDKLVGVLLKNGIEVSRSSENFSLGSKMFQTGDYIVSTSQPNGVLVRSLLSEAFYPDNPVTRRADGSIIRPYDLANFVLSEHMGVEAVPVDTPLDELRIPSSILENPPKKEGKIEGSGNAGWLLSHKPNDAFRAINRLLDSGADVFWLRDSKTAGGREFAAGVNWIPAGNPEMIRQLSAEFGLEFFAQDRIPSGPALKLKPLRLGLYRRYLGGNIDEGWTRLILDRWEFPYQRVDVDGIQHGILEQLDVLLIPSDSAERMSENTDLKKPDEEEDIYPEVFLPPEFRKGLSEEDYAAIDRFIRRGGTLILLDQASELAWTKFKVPARDITKGLEEKEYFCPGSNLWAKFDTSHPLAYGMPKRGLVLNRNSPAFVVEPSQLNEKISAPVVYSDRNLLKSGWLIGENHLVSKPIVLDAEYGDGRIILIGFRAQHRAQTHGTFKVLFNALYYGSAENVRL